MRFMACFSTVLSVLALGACQDGAQPTKMTAAEQQLAVKAHGSIAQQLDGLLALGFKVQAWTDGECGGVYLLPKDAFPEGQCSPPVESNITTIKAMLLARSSSSGASCECPPVVIGDKCIPDPHQLCPRHKL